MKIGAVLFTFLILVSSPNLTLYQGLHSQESGNSTSSEVANENNNPGAKDSTFEINRFLVSIQPSPKQITRINESCGIVIRIDTMKIATLKGSTPSDLDKFYTVADDENANITAATDFLSKVDLQIVHPKTRYLHFTVSDSTVIFDTTPACANGWGYTILYKKGEMPMITHTIDVRTTYKEYFTAK